MTNLNRIDEKIIEELNNEIEKNPNYLDFLNSNNKDYTHGYHTYPATMIPQLPRKLINLVAKYSETKINNIYDPFLGSGTTLVEGEIAGLDSFGNDINPLSILMTKAKTTAIDPKYLEEKINLLKNKLTNLNISGSIEDEDIIIPNFPRIDFWFKPDVIKQLAVIKKCIYEIEDIKIRNFCIVAFTETVRYVSNTRNSEFKLYRMAPKTLEKWNPDVTEVFLSKLDNNQQGNKELYTKLSTNRKNKVEIKLHSSMQITDLYPQNNFDLLITSPPYGDSSTTVAYGQFSRLSLQWADLDPDIEENILKLDRIMLGGKVDRSLDYRDQLKKLGSDTLTNIYNELTNNEDNIKRAKQVLQFYMDLDVTLQQIAEVMKPNSYQFWVVANRTVKGLQLPTDQIIAEMFEKYKIKYLYRFYRNIPNKRMPKRNSPTNKKGKLMNTMNKEIIIMLRKEN